MFNTDNVVKFKGHIGGIVNIILKETKRGERNGKLAAVTIDHYLTETLSTLLTKIPYLTSDTQKELKITQFTFATLATDKRQSRNRAHNDTIEFIIIQWPKAPEALIILALKSLALYAMYSLVRYVACLALTRPMRVRIDVWFTCSPYLHMTSNFFAKKKNELLFKDAIRGGKKKKKKKKKNLFF
jgi:hypothetical protein